MSADKASFAGSPGQDKGCAMSPSPASRISPAGRTAAGSSSGAVGSSRPPVRVGNTCIRRQGLCLPTPLNATWLSLEGCQLASEAGGVAAGRCRLHQGCRMGNPGAKTGQGQPLKG